MESIRERKNIQKETLSNLQIQAIMKEQADREAQMHKVENYINYTNLDIENIIEMNELIKQDLQTSYDVEFL
jgi:phosphosulfolactate synthase (CoM biosynthesis protein A)